MQRTADFGMEMIASESVRKQRTLAAVLLAAIYLATSTIGFLITARLLPGADSQTRALVVLIVMTLALLMYLASTRQWRLVGLRALDRRTPWALLFLPLALVLIPLLGGVEPIAFGALAFLLVGYALTGFTEETFFRGRIRNCKPLADTDRHLRDGTGVERGVR